MYTVVPNSSISPLGNPHYHFIRANNRQTVYDSSDGGRLFLTIPFTGPQVGAEFQVELLSFMCFNSCGHSSHSKRRIDIIFMLENKYVGICLVVVVVVVVVVFVFIFALLQVKSSKGVWYVIPYCILKHFTLSTTHPPSL